MKNTEASQQPSTLQDASDQKVKKAWKAPSFQQIRSQDTHSGKNLNQINGGEIFVCYGSAS